MQTAYYSRQQWGSAPANRGPSSGPRSGKWTVEEQEYVKELIEQFQEGSLQMDEGISLR
jgi:hypothetical protein